jgi:hypothetical protein
MPRLAFRRGHRQRHTVATLTVDPPPRITRATIGRTAARPASIAIEGFTRGRAALTAAGLSPDDDFDLWTARVTGLAGQQLANDPKGDRHIRLIDNAVVTFAEHVFDQHGASHATDA